MVPWGGVPVQKPWLKQKEYGVGGMWGPPAQKPWQPWAPGQQLQPWAGGPRPARKPPQTVPANFLVDTTVRYTGTVAFYAKWKGYGFINVAQPGVVPGDQLFVHWRQIASDDRFPFLMKDLEVEFGVMTWSDNQHKTAVTIRASNVTMPGGMNVAIQDDIDAQQKAFVGGQHLRYTGTLKFFMPKAGFGYVAMDQGYDVDPNVPNELRVELTEVNAGGRQPVRMENLAVEFGIWRSLRGAYKVYNMTLPGGHPLTQDALENRISMGPQTYRGEVGIWNWRHGWGFVRGDPNVVLPPRVLAKLEQQQQAARQRGKTITDEKMLYFRRSDCAPGVPLQQGSPVTFQVYIDDKGAGANDVRSAT